MIDQHLHTYFSFDSDAQFEDYLRQTTTPLVTTDHLELANPDDAGRDDMPDYAAYVAKLDRLHAQYPNQLLRGVEVGYYAPRAADLAAYVAAHDYDLVLLSVHHDGHHDYLDDSFKQADLQALVHTYYDKMLAAVQAVDYADVLAHFDYGLRIHSVTPAQLEAWAKPQLTQIFAAAVAKGLAFELNTKSMYIWGNAALYDLAIPWYQAAGGTKFTIGSDAHVTTLYRDHFAEASALLQAHGVTHIVEYRHHQPTPCAL